MVKRFEEFKQVNENVDFHVLSDGMNSEVAYSVLKAIKYWKIAYKGLYDQVQWGLTEFNLETFSKQCGVSACLVVEFILSGAAKETGCNLRISKSSPSGRSSLAMTPGLYYEKYSDLIKLTFCHPAKV